MPYALTPEVRVHDYTEGRQSAAESIALRDGGYITVWSGSGPQDQGYGVYLQRYDASGARVGVPMLVNTTTLYSQRNPEIVALQAGGFAIVWDDTVPGVAATNGLFAQTFDASGARVGGETRVSLDGSFHQVAAVAGGGFVVTWTHQVEYPFSVVSARLFDASGQPRGASWILNDDQIAGFSNVVATDTGFIAVWRGSTGVTIGVQAYDASGARLGQTLRIPRDGDSTMPEIVRLADGQFVLVWAEAAGLYGQILSGDGQVSGGRFLVQTNPAGASLSHSVVATPDGGFTVAWDAYSGAGRGVIAAASFFGDGARNGDTLTIRTGQTQGEPPALVVLANGDIVVSYARYVGDSINFFDVFQTRLSLTPTTLNGSAAADHLLGSRGGDRLLGGDGDDVLEGLAGDDFLIGGRGNDRLDGGAGWDEAVFSGAASRYKYFEQPDGSWLVSGQDGFDILTGVEVLRFDDRTVDLTRMIFHGSAEDIAMPIKGAQTLPAESPAETAPSPIVPDLPPEPAAADWGW